MAQLYDENLKYYGQMLNTHTNTHNYFTHQNGHKHTKNTHKTHIGNLQKQTLTHTYDANVNTHTLMPTRTQTYKHTYLHNIGKTH